MSQFYVFGSSALQTIPHELIIEIIYLRKVVHTVGKNRLVGCLAFHGR